MLRGSGSLSVTATVYKSSPKKGSSHQNTLQIYRWCLVSPRRGQVPINDPNPWGALSVSVGLSLPHQGSHEIPLPRFYTFISGYSGTSLFEDARQVCENKRLASWRGWGGSGSFGEMYTGIVHTEPIFLVFNDLHGAQYSVQETMFSAADCLCRFSFGLLSRPNIES